MIFLKIKFFSGNFFYCDDRGVAPSPYKTGGSGSA